MENTTTDHPPFIDLVPPRFIMWGDASAFSVRIDEVYNETVPWRHTLFEVLRGRQGCFLSVSCPVC